MPKLHSITDRIAVGTGCSEKTFLVLQGVTCLGFTDLPSRLPTQSSTLYSNNISKFLLSAGPFTTKVKDAFQIDHKDDAVRGALVLEQGELRWPAPPPAVSPPAFNSYSSIFTPKRVSDGPALLFMA